MVWLLDCFAFGVIATVFVLNLRLSRKVRRWVAQDEALLEHIRAVREDIVQTVMPTSGPN